MITEYHIEYITQNTYDTPVTEAIFEFMVAPCTDDTQKITTLQFSNSLGEKTFHYNNLFGFDIARLRSVKPFTDFQFVMRATVDKENFNPFMISCLPAEDELQELHSSHFQIDYHLYLQPTSYTCISAGNANKILYLKPGQGVFSYLRELTNYLYTTLKFDPEATDINTKADDVLSHGKGVCQDYTHIFLAMARANGIPCRYVSGYLNQGGSLVGSLVMHAWAEAYIPGVGWRGFDPTNDLLADVNHIKASHGVDYSDCAPIKGILKTNGGNQTTYQVKVHTPQVKDMQQ